MKIEECESIAYYFRIVRIGLQVVMTYTVNGQVDVPREICRYGFIHTHQQ